MNIKTIHTSDKEVSAKALFKGDIGSATAIQLQENGVLKEHITKTLHFVVHYGKSNL